MLLHMTPDDPALARSLRATVAAYEAAFPGQIVAYYLVGSCADHTALATSDVDVDIIFRLPPDDAQRASATSLALRDSPLPVDPTIWSLESLAGGVPPNLKVRGRLVHGEDVCQALPIMPIERWARERMHAACWLLAHVYQRPLPMPLAVGYPNVADGYFGYLNRPVALESGEQVASTRNLLRTAGWIASALLAHQAGVYVVRKRDMPALYHQHIGGAWAGYLDELHARCIDAWRYLIPNAPADRLRLRTLWPAHPGL